MATSKDFANFPTVRKFSFIWKQWGRRGERGRDVIRGKIGSPGAAIGALKGKILIEQLLLSVGKFGKTAKYFLTEITSYEFGFFKKNFLVLIIFFSFKVKRGFFFDKIAANSSRQK